MQFLPETYYIQLPFLDYCIDGKLQVSNIIRLVCKRFFTSKAILCKLNNEKKIYFAIMTIEHEKTVFLHSCKKCTFFTQGDLRE